MEQTYNLLKFEVPSYLVEPLKHFKHEFKFILDRYFEIKEFSIDIYDHSKTTQELQQLVSQLRKVKGLTCDINKEHGWATFTLPIKSRGFWGNRIQIHGISERFIVCTDEDRKKALQQLLKEEYEI